MGLPAPLLSHTSTSPLCRWPVRMHPLTATRPHHLQPPHPLRRPSLPHPSPGTIPDAHPKIPDPATPRISSVPLSQSQDGQLGDSPDSHPPVCRVTFAYTKRHRQARDHHIPDDRSSHTVPTSTYDETTIGT